MADAAASPLGSGDIGAAFAAAGGAGAAQAGGGAPAPGGAPRPGGSPAAPVQSLDFILDIPLKVTVELGRAKMAIRDILQLSQGSVIELSKFAGEPLEVLVNDKLIARGEVVVVNEKFGIRLTDIISPIERIEQLK
ncbi:flagellar motor switch protein FliN [bacterium]|nr:flagellar motor switch protein FliN [bacterium]